MNDVLVTGGAGFVGSHLCERLVERCNITVLDDFSTGKSEHVDFLDEEDIVQGDVTEPALVDDVVGGHDTVIHLAAMMGVQRTLENPVSALENNIDGTRAVLRAAANHDINRVLIASTSEVYGDGPTPPYAESNMTAPITDYAVAKLAGEHFTRALATSSDFDYTILRYFNVYGPRQDSSKKGYVIPIFIRQALRDEPISVHGDGNQTRDFTYIDDAVDCTLAALGDAGRNETFNVGTGTEKTITELAELVRETVGAGNVTHVDHPRPYVVERRCADTKKSREKLGYEQSYSLQEGIARTAEALRDAASATAGRN